MIFGVDVFRFGGAVRESHVLQFAFAACIADRAVERMIAQQHFHHALARLMNFRRVGRDDHALADHGRARSLQLGHLLDFDQAHPAGTLQRQIWVVAK